MRAPVQLPPQVLGLNIYMHVHLRLRDSHDHAGWHVSTHAGLGKGTQVSVPMRVRPSCRRPLCVLARGGLGVERTASRPARLNSESNDTEQT